MGCLARKSRRLSYLLTLLSLSRCAEVEVTAQSRRLFPLPPPPQERMAFQPQSTEMQIFRAHVMGIDDLAALQHALPPIEEVIADIALRQSCEPDSDSEFGSPNFSENNCTA